ncbi:MAG: ribosome maturation factor RimP [Candidatus Krumholzibacteriota bacterium]|nr:ribosome maturation factor RimP [Candidatus Krumholzibacteriota bacterium]
MDKEGRLIRLLEGEVENLGFEFLKLDSYARGRKRILRIFIDEPQRGVTLDDCVQVTRTIGLALDREGLMPGPYNLEVSSPGINRPLVKLKHFERFRDKDVKVEHLSPGGEKESFIGRIVATGVDSVTFRVGMEERQIDFARILKAHLYGEKWEIKKHRVGKRRSDNPAL